MPEAGLVSACALRALPPAIDCLFPAEGAFPDRGRGPGQEVFLRLVRRFEVESIDNSGSVCFVLL